MGCNQLYSLSWGEFSSCLSSTVQILRGHGDLVDVTLAAGGKIFPAHKLVLSAASPLLMELLKSTQCQHPVVMLAGIAASDLEALLQFVYQGEVSVDPSQLPSLLQAAQCLDIQALSPATMPSDRNVVGGPVDNRLGIPVIRKRKRKAKLTCHQQVDSMSDDPNAPSSQQMEQSQDCKESQDIKDNDELTGMKKLPLISDLPVSCGICGAMLRQSRNLRRHMELIHMKPEDPPRKRRTKKCPELPSHQNTVHRETMVGGGGVSSVGVGVGGEPPGEGRPPPPPPGPPPLQPQPNSQPEMPGHDRSQQQQQTQQQQQQAVSAAVLQQQTLSQQEAVAAAMGVYHHHHHHPGGGGPPGGGPPPGFLYHQEPPPGAYHPQQPPPPPPQYPPPPQPHQARPPDLN